MNRMALILGALLISSFTHAQWGKKIKGNGQMVTVERTTEAYDGISVSGWFDVDLVDGKEGEIILNGEENLLEHIRTEVKNGTLVIKVEKGVQLNPSRANNGIRITVPVEAINAVSFSGSGEITGKKALKAEDFTTSMSGSGDISLEIHTNTLTASMSGSGDIHLSGKAHYFEVSISGSGDIKAYDLDAQNVEATVSGSANIDITVRETLKARVSGSGDITYRGNPSKIDTKASGSGDISKG